MSLAEEFSRIRKDFPMLQSQMHGHPLIYFDTAATAQKPQVMIDSLGQEEWQKMQKRLTEITDVSSEILVMSPPHSNLEAHGDGGAG